MDIKIGIRDRRNPGWYRIDNEVYDIPMSCEALAVYNAIARFAGNENEKAYFSGKKWKKHHKVGNGKLSEGIRALISLGLIRPTGEKTKVGAPYYELCNIDHLKKTLFQGGIGCGSEVEQGGIPRRNTNYTNKTKQVNKTKSASGNVKPFSEKETVERITNELLSNGIDLDKDWLKWEKQVSTLLIQQGCSFSPKELYRKNLAFASSVRVAS